MNLSERLEPVLAAARGASTQVDSEGRFPIEAVTALRDSGLLGLTLPTDIGGLGAGPVELVDVLRRLSAECGSTAMVYLMHISATMATAAASPSGRPDLLKRLAGGELLATLALSEAGSRSHFWAPTSQGETTDDGILLTVRKSWVTSAGYADLYVVSTRTPGASQEQCDLYVVPADADGVQVTGAWRGLGLRGNASAPMTFGLTVSAGDRLGDAGTGLDLMLQAVLPWFNLGNAAVSVGLARAALDAATRHVTGAKLEHLGDTLAALPTIRAALAKAALELAATTAYVDAAAVSVATPDETTMLQVLGVKAVANDAALHVTDAAMRMCGGAAFSAHLQIDRYFRDARAGHVMAPTADVLYDFYGKALTGQPLF
ncbi:Rv1679 family acyl-CoA dehydrogenase [Actinoplanes auranticolor]|uniref:Acyl-CoA dehydrogenase n=1 Tax=Actinoplanes auranticolor TaxID=47988 RepID=A0A919SIL4_9ACTN|nr:acyl-CoA dehydrogenase family protein [Actinoplanes auranticolor]GIM71373.1 acyl-CoA dehydrogenase [Actinoplanes auranticolor]